MNHYPHHIGDFNNATRHLTRVERALYRDLIELYYDTETALQATDFDKLARRICCTDDEKAALRDVLNEFFVRDGDVYTNSRCDKEIARYHSQIDVAKRAGRASAERRANDRSTPVQRTCNQPEPEPEPLIEAKASTRRRASKKCPDEFQTIDTQEFVDANLPGLDWQAELAKFRDHEFVRPKTDWAGAWRNWMRKAYEAKQARAPTEGNYARQMREKYELLAPMVAAKPPGAKRLNPMDVLDGLTRISDRPDLLEMQSGVRPGLHEPVGGT